MFVVTLLTGILIGEKTTIIERIQDFASNNLSYDAQPIFYSSNFQYIFYSFISVASILGNKTDIGYYAQEHELLDNNKQKKPF